MNPAESEIRQVVAEVSPLLEPDGGFVDVDRIDGDVVRLRYHKGSNPGCADCVMPVEDFRDYMRDLLITRIQGLADVHVIED